MLSHSLKVVGKIDIKESHTQAYKWYKGERDVCYETMKWEEVTESKGNEREQSWGLKEEQKSIRKKAGAIAIAFAKFLIQPLWKTVWQLTVSYKTKDN